MPEDAAQLIRRLVQRIWNEGATDELSMFFTDPFDHGGRQDTTTGLRQWHRRQAETWAGVHYELLDMVSDEVSVAARWEASGRHVGPWGPVQATGAQVNWQGVHFFSINDGLIRSMWAITDTFSTAQQLGVRFEPPARQRRAQPEEG